MGQGQPSYAMLTFVDKELRRCEKRRAFFPVDATFDATWNILLFMFANQHRLLSVGEVCNASGAPRPTAGRYISTLEQYELVEKDARPGFKNIKRLRLTPGAQTSMRLYLEEVGYH